MQRPLHLLNYCLLPTACVWGFHTQVYVAPPPILVVCSSLSLCVSLFLCLARLCSAGISGSVRSCGGGLALTSPPPPPQAQPPPLISDPLPCLTHPTNNPPPQFLVAKSGETQEARLPASPSRKAPLQSPPPLPTHAQFKNTKPGLVALSAASLSAQRLPGPLPAHSFPIHTQSAQLWAPWLPSWGTLSPQLPATPPPALGSSSEASLTADSTVHLHPSFCSLLLPPPSEIPHLGQTLPIGNNPAVACPCSRSG